MRHIVFNRVRFKKVNSTKQLTLIFAEFTLYNNRNSIYKNLSKLNNIKNIYFNKKKIYKIRKKTKNQLLISKYLKL